MSEVPLYPLVDSSVVDAGMAMGGAAASKRPASVRRETF
jgi:hypothetical protein